MRRPNVGRGISAIDGSYFGVQQTMLRSKDVGVVGHKKLFGDKALSNSFKGRAVLNGELYEFFTLSDDLNGRENDLILFLEPSSFSLGSFDFFRTVLEQDQGIIEGTDGFVQFILQAAGCNRNQTALHQKKRKDGISDHGGGLTSVVVVVNNNWFALFVVNCLGGVFSFDQ